MKHNKMELRKINMKARVGPLLNKFGNCPSRTVSNGPPRLSICHQRAVHKRKKSWIVLNTTTYFVLNCNALAFLSFYALPSGDKLKDAVVHC